MLLYHNKIGYIYYGIFNGLIEDPISSKQMAPDWSSTEIQKHLC